MAEFTLSDEEIPSSLFKDTLLEEDLKRPIVKLRAGLSSLTLLLSCKFITSLLRLSTIPLRIEFDRLF